MTAENEIVSRLSKKLWNELSQQPPVDVWSKVVIPAVGRMGVQEQARLVEALLASKERELGRVLHGLCYQIVRERAKNRAAQALTLNEVLG